MTRDVGARSASALLLTVLVVVGMVGPAIGVAGAQDGTAEPAEPTLEVSIDSVNAPVVEGETLTVEVTVENVGDQPDTQEVTLSADGHERDSTEVTLDPGGSTTTSLTWATESGDAGEHPVTVSSDGSTDSTDVLVAEASEFDVTIDRTNSPVVEGETLTVDATVVNTGGYTDTQEVSLVLTSRYATLVTGGEDASVQSEGRLVDSMDVTLEPERSRTVTFEWETTEGDAGPYTARVSTETATASRNLFVQPPPEFDVSIDGTNAPVTEGETLSVDATVRNVGEATTDIQDVSMIVGESEVDTTEAALEPGQSTTVTLEWQTSNGDAGDHLVHVASPDDEDTSEVTVEAGSTPTPRNPDPVDLDGSSSAPSPSINVTDVSIEGEVEPGEPATVSVELENDGDASGVHEINLTADGEVVYEQEHHLDAGESRTITVAPTFDAEDEYEISADGESVGTVTVSDAAETDEPTPTEVTETEERGAAEAPDDTPEQSTTEGTGPGFAVAATLLALLSVGLWARTRSE